MEYLKRDGISTDIEEIKFEILRMRALKKHPDAMKMFFTDETLRFATPKEVGEYRAKRISGSGAKIIADLCSGIGLQAIEFARYFEKVYAVEVDQKKIEIAKRNASALGISNIEFLRADIFQDQTIEKIKDAEAIFCDPSRSPSEEERRLEQIPEIRRIISDYSGITDNICIEAPPQIPPERINLDCEAEYLSLYWKLNRLNLYFGALKRCDRSAILLPGEDYLQSRNIELKLKRTEDGRFIYEVNPAVRKAGLIAEAIPPDFDAGIFYEDKKDIMLASDEPFESPYLRRYKIMERCSRDPSEINRRLIALGAGRALIRGRIAQDEYWNFRNTLERGLSGSATFHIFLTGDSAVICREF
jgi:SAM-dependent methyltransferase